MSAAKMKVERALGCEIKKVRELLHLCERSRAWLLPKFQPSLADKTYDEVVQAYAYDGIGVKQALEISIESARQKLKLGKSIAISAVFDLRPVEKTRTGVSK
jgi:hypothetical protein